MSKQDIKQVVLHTRDTEVLRTSHWWFSKRGPAFIDVLVHMGDRSIDTVKPFVKKGQIVADLGCGWGRYSFKLADHVGPDGKVFAIDLAEQCVQKVRKKAQKGGYRNIVACTSTAADIGFIKDASIDFVYANGLLCSMACEREAAVSEIKRIVKPSGMVYLSLGAAPPMGYVDETEWHAIIGDFNLIQGGSFKEKWSLLSVS